MFLTAWQGHDIWNPIANPTFDTRGEASGWFGWAKDDKLMALRAQFMRETDDAKKKKMAEARKLMAQGDEEYRLAVPGSREVNVHRRKALDLFTKARGLFEEVDRDAGYDAHLDEIHDLNRNIAELRKDLPVGK